jgi:hypothetical protein
LFRIVSVQFGIFIISPSYNLDSCVLVLSGKLMKLSTTLVFTSLSEKIFLVVIIIIDPILF